jgi:multiple sugar transport system substrate-binding protein
MHHTDTPAYAPDAEEPSIISRRELLQRATAVGLGAASISVLADYTTQSAAHAAATPVNLWETIPTDTEKFWISTLLPKFAKMHPECQIVPRQLGVENPALIRAGLKAGGSKAPDMCWIESGETGAYVAANVLADVQVWLDKNPAIKNNIFPSLNQLATFQGKIWSLPWMTNNTCMLINVDAFNKAGVPIPSQDPAKTWTWEQFASACARLTRGGMKGFLITVGSTWTSWTFHAWLAQAGGVFLQDDGTATFNSAAGVEAVTFQRSLVSKGYTAFSESGKGYDPAPFFAGKVAIEINGPWNFSAYSTFKDFKMTAVPYPRHKKIATNVGGDQLFIFNHGAAKNACSFAYGAYMLTDDFQVAFQINSGNLPVTKTATRSKAYQDHLRQYPFLYGWVNGVPYSVARSSLPQSTDVQTIFSNAWDDIMLKGADIKSRLDQAAQQATALKGQ